MDKPSAVSVERYWNQLLAPYMKSNNRKAWFQLLTTCAMFTFIWYVMLLSLEGPYWVTLLLALIGVGLFTRIFIFQHDCGHASFFKSRSLNNSVGFFLGVLTLTPYSYWRRAHAHQHATSGDLDRRSLGDVDTLTVKEYLALSRWGRIKYRMYRHPVTLFLLGGVWLFVLKHRFPWDIPRSWKKEWASVIWTNLAIVGLVALAWNVIGIERFLLVQLPITIIGGSIGIWLFYIQHQFEDTYWRNTSEWNFHRAGIEGSSLYDLPSILHWFTGNIGFHHIHHLASRIPNYRLKECFRKVPEVHGVTRLTFWQSLRSARLHLWDEDSRKLVGFGFLRTLQTAA